MSEGYKEGEYMRFLRKKKRLIKYPVCLIWILLCVLLSGCGSQKSSDNASMATTDTYEMAEEFASADMSAALSSEVDNDQGESGGLVQDGSGGTEAVSVNDTERKLIKTKNIGVETKEFDTFLDKITQKVTELGGYVEHSDISGNSMNATYNRFAYYVIRIPEDKLDEFTGAVENSATVVSKSENVDDITLNYVDTESRIKSLKTEQEALLSMLESAETLEEIIAIQSRLTEVRYELESYESQLRTYDNQIHYSTVNLNVSEVDRVTKAADRTFGSRLKERFLSSIYWIRDAGVNFAIWFLGSFPILLLMAVIIALIAWVICAIIKSLNRKSQRQNSRRKEWKAEKSPDSQEMQWSQTVQDESKEQGTKSEEKVQDMQNREKE